MGEKRTKFPWPFSFNSYVTNYERVLTEVLTFDPFLCFFSKGWLRLKSKERICLVLPYWDTQTLAFIVWHTWEPHYQWQLVPRNYFKWKPHIVCVIIVQQEDYLPNSNFAQLCFSLAFQAAGMHHWWPERRHHTQTPRGDQSRQMVTFPCSQTWKGEFFHFVQWFSHQTLRRGRQNFANYEWCAQVSAKK